MFGLEETTMIKSSMAVFSHLLLMIQEIINVFDGLAHYFTVATLVGFGRCQQTKSSTLSFRSDFEHRQNLILINVKDVCLLI